MLIGRETPAITYLLFRRLAERNHIRQVRRDRWNRAIGKLKFWQRREPA